MFLLLVSYGLLKTTFAQNEGQFPQSITASTSTDMIPHLIKLKGTQQGGAETRVSGFSIDAASAIGAQANSQLLVLIPDSALRVSEAKARTSSNQVFNLPYTASQQATSAFSLANLPVGVYTLDVITQKDGAKGAYGGVLSIGNQPTTVIEETTKRVTNDYGDLKLVFLPPDCDVPNPPPVCEEPPPPDCDLPNPPPECVPTECPDGSTIPPGEQCPDEPPEEVPPEDRNGEEDGDGSGDGSGDGNGDGDGSGDGNGDGDGSGDGNGDGS
jgi:hypothetical protein